MKKLLSIVAIGAAVGAAAYAVNRKNEKHVEETLEALDEISASAEEAVNKLAEEVQNEEA